MLKLAVAILVCASAVFGEEYDDVKVEHLPIRSCDPKSGVVCLPSACSNATCAILKEATCITDRCGCDARFFLLGRDPKSARDITKMCQASTSAMSFVHFMEAEHLQMDAAHHGGTVKFLKDFKILITELIKEVKIVSAKSATAENIRKLRAANELLRQLHDVGTELSDFESDGEEMSARLIAGDILDKFKKVATTALGRRVPQTVLKADEEGQSDTETVLGMSGNVVLSNSETRDVLMKILDTITSMSRSKVPEIIQVSELTTMEPEEVTKTIAKNRKDMRKHNKNIEDGVNFKISVKN